MYCACENIVKKNISKLNRCTTTTIAPTTTTQTVPSGASPCDESTFYSANALASTYKKYWFSTQSQKRSYSRSLENCEQFSFDLAMPKSQEEMDVLKSRLST